MKCTHLHNIVQLSLVELCKLKKDESCTDCETNGPNLWICLQKNCLHIGCSEQYKDHSTIHFQSNRTHCVHMNLSSQRVWCYLCQSEIFLSKPMQHHHQQQQQQQQHQQHYNRFHHYRRGSVVSNDSSDTSRYSSVNKDKLVLDVDKLLMSGSGSGAAAAASGSASAGAKGHGQPSSYTASTGDSCDSSGEEDDFERQGKWNGLVGLQNLANTCYMNAALQALSNSPPLTGFFLDCGAILETDLLGGNNPAVTKPGLAKHYHKLIREMWCKNRRYVVPSGILCGIRIVHPMFRGYQQHDTQEFLRCFMDQLHEELKEVLAPPPPDVLTSSSAPPDDEMELVRSEPDRPSPCSSPSPSQSEAEYETCESGGSEQSSLSDDPFSSTKANFSKHFEHRLKSRSPSPPPVLGSAGSINQRMTTASRSLRSSGAGSSYAVSRQQSPVGSNRSNGSSVSSTIGVGAMLSNSSPPGGSGGGAGDNTAESPKDKLPQRSIISDIFDGKLLSSVQCLTCDRVSTREETFQDLSLPIPGKDHLAVLHQSHSGMGGGPTGVLVGVSSASVAGSGSSGGGVAPGSGSSGPSSPAGGGGGGGGSGITCSDAVYPMVNSDSWLAWLWNSPLWSWLRSLLWGPAVTLHDCMAAFFSADELKGDNMYSCERCNKLRNGVKYSRVLALPEMLCVHLKRFRHDLSYSSKISSPVHFPLCGLDMRPYLHKDCKSEVTSYDLCAVICHHGTVGGGHYTSFAKHDPTGKWFEFDDQLVTQVTPEYVESCEAYVLFYRKNNAKMATVRAQASNLLTMQEHASDIRFYVSRNWLHRFNTFAEPGPIDNWTLLCPHGAFPPNKASHFSKLVVPFPQALWDFLYKKFGGGPVCNHIFPCHICKKAAETLSRRQRYELETFTTYNDEFQFNDTPTTIYAISMAWFRQWQLFARGLTNDDPGPINNKSIIVPGDTSVPLRNVRPFSDYAQINASLWHFFHGIYGGGPEIVLQGNPVAPPTVTTAAASILDECARAVEPQQVGKHPKQHRTSESMDVTEDNVAPSAARSSSDDVKHSDRDSAIEVTITEPQPAAGASAVGSATAAVVSSRPHKSVSFEDTDAYCDDDDEDEDDGDNTDEGGDSDDDDGVSSGSGSGGDNADDKDDDGDGDGGSSKLPEQFSGLKRRSYGPRARPSRRGDPSGSTKTVVKVHRKEWEMHTNVVARVGKHQPTEGNATAAAPLTNGDAGSTAAGEVRFEIGTKKDRRHKGGQMKANGFFGPEGKYQSSSNDYPNNGAGNGHVPRTESYTHAMNGRSPASATGAATTVGTIASSASVPSFGTESTAHKMTASSSAHLATHDPTSGHGSDQDEDDKDSRTTNTTTTSGGNSSSGGGLPASAKHSGGRKGGRDHHHGHHGRHHGGGGSVRDASPGGPLPEKGREGAGGGGMAAISFGRRKLKIKYMKKLAGRSGSSSRSGRNNGVDRGDEQPVDSNGRTPVLSPLTMNGVGESHEGIK